MPAHDFKSIDVNLLPKDPFAQSSFGRLLNWTLSVGRYIVIFTEMIVILTFLSRFTLDRQLTDLNEDILKKQALLQSYEEFEVTLRAIQDKAKFIESLAAGPQVTDIISDVAAKAPVDVIFAELSTRDNKITLTATAFSSASLSQFVDAIKQDPRFSNVFLDKISTTDTDTGINFVVRAEFNQT